MLDKNTKEDEKFIYIVETSRSSYERGNEHYKELEYKRHKSHMLKFAVKHHSNMNPAHVQFSMQMLSCHKSVFARQIREAVLIAGPRIMNRKLEYNRCYIQQIIMKVGNKKQLTKMVPKKKK